MREQEETVDEQQILDNLQNDLNKLLSAEQNEVLSNIELKVTGSDEKNMKLEIAGVTVPLKWNTQRRRGSFATKEALGFGKVGTKQFLETLEENNQYKQLLEKYPKIREQIEGGFVKLIIRPQTPGKSAFIELAPTGMSGKERRKGIPLNLGDTFTLKDLLVNNLVQMKFNDKVKGQLFTDNMSWKLSSLALDNSSIGGDDPTPGPTITPKVFSFNAQENFDFNRANLRQEAKDEIIVQIINPIKSMSETNRRKYIAELEKSPITLRAFASRDDDPDDTDYNTDPRTRRKLYQPCINEGTRGEYNQCLSDARAQTVTGHLQTEFGDI